MLKSPSRTRDLRSSDQNVLFVPRIKTKKGEAFFFCGCSKIVESPHRWNQNFKDLQKKSKNILF